MTLAQYNGLTTKKSSSNITWTYRVLYHTSNEYEIYKGREKENF